MDGYVLRKKRKLTDLTDVKQVEGDRFPTVSAGSEDDSTDVKLAILASLFPDIDQSSLLDILISSEGSVQQVCRVLSSSAETSPRKKTANGIGYQTSLASFRNARAGLAVESTSVLQTAKTRKGQTLHLYIPEDIEMYTPCSLIHNFLPAQVAEDLLKELLEEAPSFERQTFKMFDSVVQSPHSACFYVENLDEKKRQQTEYLYNGSFLTVSLRFS
ncbi:MAG: hypothetical protein Q9172_002096 [Xanthocarpia lactea]